MMIEGYIVAWRDGERLKTQFVERGSRTSGSPAVEATACGVSIDGISVEAGRASRVRGTTVVCLKAETSRSGERTVSLGKMVGASDAMIGVMFQAAAAGLTREPVLVFGESGTGKELIADYLGSLCGPEGRAPGGLHALNMGAIPLELAEAELFGWVRGAFTGAVDSKPGALELAGRGVLFLDEIGEAPAWVQVKLLRALESRRFRRLGGPRDIPFEARVVAATNLDPIEAISAGRLRLDLVERLACHVIRIPPLRTRPADLPCLVSRFVSMSPAGIRESSAGFRPNPEVMDTLRRWPWHGNVRELRNVVGRMLLISADGLQSAAVAREALEAGRFFPEDGTAASATPIPSRSEEIAALALPRSTFYYRLKRGRIPSDSGPRRTPSAATKT